MHGVGFIFRIMQATEKCVLKGKWYQAKWMQSGIWLKSTYRCLVQMFSYSYFLFLIVYFLPWRHPERWTHCTLSQSTSSNLIVGQRRIERERAGMFWVRCSDLRLWDKAERWSFFCLWIWDRDDEQWWQFAHEKNKVFRQWKKTKFLSFVVGKFQQVPQRAWNLSCGGWRSSVVLFSSNQNCYSL